MENQFGMKELDEVILKSTSNIEIGGRTIEKGEIVAAFDSIQVANFKEIKKNIVARGGQGNPIHIIWEETRQMQIDFAQGIFSKTQFALMNGSKIYNIEPSKAIGYTVRKNLESNEEGVITLSGKPRKPLFVYKASTGEKLSYDVLSDLSIKISTPYTDCIVDYVEEYNNGGQILRVGSQLQTGYLELQGKMSVKEDITGQVKTALITVPKLKLMSELSIQLGRGYAPITDSLSAIALPVGQGEGRYVMDMVFLNNDIDSEM